MGQSIAGMIRSIDGGDASAKETRDTLNALNALGKSRVDAAYAEAMSDRGKMYAEISKIIFRKQSVVCKTSTDTAAIVEGVKSSVGKLMSGQILDGVTDLIQNGLNLVLGESTGQTSSAYAYALVATQLGGFLRIDVDIYNFALESQGLQTKIQNMTAISSIVSSVKPDSLTAGDIRSIVSVSYGGSSAETQKAILTAVMEAWNLDKKSQAGTLTDDDIAHFQTLLVPSKYDKDPSSSLAALTIQEAQPPKVDREELEKMFLQLRSPSDDNEGRSKLSANADGWHDLVLWIKLSNPAEACFLQWLGGTIKAFDIDEIFHFSQIQKGVSGDALSLLCQVNSGQSQELFDKAVGYVQDTIIPSLSKAGFLNNWISTFGVQYDHPTADNIGLVSNVTFNKNPISNHTSVVLTFLEPETLHTLLVLQPNTEGILTGEVDYITGEPPASDAEEPNAATTPPTQWVTYEAVTPDTVLTGMSVTATALDDGGYALNFTNSANKRESIHYNVAWPR